MPRPSKASTLALLFCFFLTLSPVAALAGPGPATETSGNPAAAKITLEEAIGIVKANFQVPESFTEFTYTYENFGSTPYWNLSWTPKGEPGGNFNARVDAASGEIHSMNHWRPDKPVGSGLQVTPVTRDQALETAKKLLNRLIPDYVGQLELLPTGSGDLKIAMPPLQSGGHMFQWQRIHQGIPFPGNTVHVTVSGVDGAVTDYSLNWTKEPLPDPAKAVTAAQARQAFLDAGMMKAQYHLNPSYRPMGSPQDLKLSLVYNLAHPSMGMIDALTGKPVDFDAIRGTYDAVMAKGGMGGMGGIGGRSQGGKSVPLTPQEQKEVEKAAKFLTQDQAIEKVKEWVAIPADYVLRNANLTNNWMSLDDKYWNFYWASESNNGYRYLSARVNALTGEVMAFDQPMPDTKEAPVINRAAAQKIAEDFLRKIQPKKYPDLTLSDQTIPPIVLKEMEKQPTQYFFFTRMVNGVQFPMNTVHVVVDTVHQRVISFNMEWSNHNFPSTEGMLTPAQAVDAFLQYRPLTLSYHQEHGPKGPKVILVYQPRVNPAVPPSTTIDAKTGEPVDWQGKPIRVIPTQPFTDLDGVAGQGEINFLGQAGIFREYGDAFHPAEPVTAVSLFRALIHAKGIYPVSENLSDQQVMDMARSQQWLQEQLEPNGHLTRQYLARVMVRTLGLQRAAEIKGIYRIDYLDADAIAPEAAGYVAIAKGLGMVTGQGDTYAPLAIVPRSEAAIAIYRSLKIQ